MSLNSWQKKHYESVRWLLTDGPIEARRSMPGAQVCKNRQRGRSYLMHYIFIEEALKYPGREILTIDHYGADSMRKFTKAGIEKQLKGRVMLHLFTVTLKSVRYDGVLKCL